MSETIDSANAAASTLFLGQNGEWWDFWLIVSLIFAAFAAIAIGITTTGSIVAHKREAVSAEAALAVFKLKTEDKIADANARAAEAKLALEKFKAPRAVTTQQRNRIAEAMKLFAGQEFFGQVASDVADAWELWREISLSLELAGWKRIGPPGLQVSQYGPPAGIALAPQAGVMLYVRATVPDDTMQRYSAAKALATTLTAEGIISGAGFASSANMDNATAIAIVIGPKP